MQLVLGWPVRILVIALLVLSVFVDGAGYWYRIANHYPLTGPAPHLPPNFNGWQLYLHKGLDLSGGTDMQLELSNFPPGRDRATVQQEAIDVIQKRINALGVSEPIVTATGSNHDRIEVQLANVNAAQAQKVIGTTAQLVTTTWVSDSSITNGPYPGYRPKITNLRSSMLTGASASLDPNGGNDWVVNFTYNSQGASIFSQLSTNAYNACPDTDCPQRHIAQWLDLTQSDVDNWNQLADKLYQPFDKGGKLLSDPQILQPITGGQGFIQGNFTQQEAQNLATLLNSGSLPVSIKVISSTDVGASLGAESVKQSLSAGLLGLIIVIIFMVALYRLPGLLASLALLFYAGTLICLFKVIPVTLTLPGLAGFVLSVGMAVDANVLIFERFKEELRAGRTIGAAVEAGVRRAWPAIRDSNTSTLITSVILYFAGAQEVKGFALTLALGVLVSLISSIIVTHNLLAIVLNFGWARSDGALGVVRGSARLEAQHGRA
ncbi:MAG TPA: protein translocase subunit SecD [Candidatus Dormibacteraeota bacterium]|nr:protein translocase subunit SecD [Candidatus Dormibacteraeota bacterium]